MGGPPDGDAATAAGEADWLSHPEALSAILTRVGPLGTERVAAADALGRALARQVTSRVRHPPWDNSAMDGFAVRAQDLEGAGNDHPVELPVSQDVPAGSFPSGPLEPGTAVRVTTGSPVPEGATGVVRVEHTDGGRDGRVAFFRDSDARRNIRRAGEDLEPGDVVAAAGREITPAVAGVLAMTGEREVEVGRRPRVGILATGDELADFDEFDAVLEGRKIMDSNSRSLAAQVRDAGGEPVLLGIAADDPYDVRARLEAGADCDALVTSAGVSVGEHDHVKAVLEEMGLERVFWRVKIRPGSPLTFGLLDGRPVWGVPGNPVSAMVTFEVFLRPAIRKMAGHRALRRRRVAARLASGLTCRRGLTYFYRVRLDGTADGAVDGAAGSVRLPAASLTGPQGSGILTSMAAAHGLMVVPEGVEELEAGRTVEVILLDDWEAGEP